MSIVERFWIAAAAGAFAFLIGMMAWWLLGSLSSIRTFALFSALFSIGSFGVALWRPKQMIDFTGVIGGYIYSFWSEVGRHFERIR